MHFAYLVYICKNVINLPILRKLCANPVNFYELNNYKQ